MLRSAFLLCLLLAADGVAAVSTTTTLAVTPLRSTLSQPVTLTATVSPATATGKVTFYDGVAIVGVSTITGGKAALFTGFLPSGPRSLQGRYWGDANFDASASNVIQVTVTSVEGTNFTPASGSPLAAGRGPDPPAVGDFNGDGILDLAISSIDGVTVLLGDGKGGFLPAVGSPFAPGLIGRIAVGDFNGDGNLDLAISNSSGVSGSVTVLLGRGNGGFTPAPGSPIVVGPEPVDAVVADLNGDGKPDLAVIDQLNSSVTILLGDGGGGFPSAQWSQFAAGPSPVAIAVADFDGDGNPDLAIPDADGSVTALLGDGNGGFAPAKNRPLVPGLIPSGIVVGDFNRDGKPDLAVTNRFGNNVVVLLGDGAGGFMPAKDSPFKVGAGPFTAAVGDFNGDGALDLAVANTSSGDVTVLLGDGNGGFAPALHSPVPVGHFPYLAVGDFNGDGRLDLVTANSTDNNASVLLATGGLAITMSQVGPFTAGQNGVYTLTVTNEGKTPVSGLVTVTDTLPGGLAPVMASGDGWTCPPDGQVVTCTRTDGLAAGAQYPPIAVTVAVAAGACPSVTNSAEVIQGVPVIASQSTPISGCLFVSQSVPSLVVNGTAPFALALSSFSPISAGVAVTVRDVLPAGLTPQTVSGQGWNCSIDSQVVLCSRNDGLAAGAQYPPISVTVGVAASACPSVTNPVEVILAGAQPQFPEPSSVDISGCLVINPPTLAFQSPLGGLAPLKTLTVTSIDKHPLQLSLAPINSTAFNASLGAVGCGGTLNPGDSCVVGVFFENICPGVQSAALMISTDSGATYPVPLQGTGLPNAVSLKLEDGTNLSDNLQVKPNEQHTVSLALTPPLSPQCPQKPTLAMSFSPLDPNDKNGTNYDTRFDPGNSMLQIGTVAGNIKLKAQVGGTDIALVSGSAGSVTLQVPSQAGVIEKLSIVNRTASTFEVAITGFSTPRGTGDLTTAVTEVCFAFSAAKGSTVDVNTQFCALKQDIEIWYERPSSYPFGSQFSGSVIVSFSGDGKAIGGVKAWVNNKAGASAPYCVDFQSGNQQDCPK